MTASRQAYSRNRLLKATALLFVTLSTVGPPCPAAAKPRLVWQDGWRRSGAPEYAVTGTALAGAATVWFLVPPASEPLWTRPLFADRRMREALRLESDAGRNAAGIISDVWLSLSVTQPLVIDSLFVAALGDKNRDVALQMEAINMQSFAITIFANTVAKRVFARQRPYGNNCLEDPNYTHSCESLDRFRSFYSGHAAVTATSAGLVCSHHTHLPLYGGGMADSLACVGSVVSTLAVGSLRIASDRHWATDVITGHLLGFAAGYLLPTLLYYGSLRATPVSEAREDPNALMPTTPPLFVYSGVL